MEDLLLQRENHIKKLVSNSKAIISNQVGLPLGMLKMNKLVSWINNIEPLTAINLQIFKEYNLLTRNYCIGTDRLMYNKDFLKAQDKELDKITLAFKDKIIDKCFEIIKTFEK